ncbi:unnamed protein product [Enterobius vermicularis]|uniref:Exostosin-1 n=1 Tax=Enterobius vermicularis TaxID=51028 RepID=A0A0N4V3Q8_ENTVE|nr:unnamed protein product [Enterobius vermicularis]
MARCFNLSRCLLKKQFKVYLYPTNNVSTISVVYANILQVLRESSYYTEDYHSACVFILGIDTTDRDRRRHVAENFVKHVNDLVHSLPPDMWNEGRNHIIFNLYHGTFPDYSDHDLGFDVGYAMIARASANAQMFRRDFDLSFPLFHKEHPLRTSVESVWPLKLEDRHLVTFKGKRYVYGIGSETRDSLYHLHNGRSSVMVTTCKHNTDWKKYEDQSWDYEGIMSNSTFCLTPRGRRLGSFRFLESLKLGCIPVVLSDDWVLPFSEVIDWSQAAIIAHEDSVLTITDILNAIPMQRVLHMKQQARGLYQRYLSSVEKIVTTSIKIVEERINKQKGLPPRQWNTETYNILAQNTDVKEEGCTVILQATAKVSARLNRHIQMLLDLPFIQKDQSTMFSVAYLNYDKLVGDFILLFDERINLSKQELTNIYRVARSEPGRLAGLYGAVHQETADSWTVDFTPLQERSIALPYLLFFKRIFLHDLWQWIPKPAKIIAEKIPQCFTLLLNFMVTEKQFKPPIFVSGRSSEPWIPHRNYSLCLRELVKKVWSSGPLLLSTRMQIDSVVTA